jgi:hypothetical protein
MAGRHNSFGGGGGRRAVGIGIGMGRCCCGYVQLEALPRYSQWLLLLPRSARSMSTNVIRVNRTMLESTTG